MKAEAEEQLKAKLTDDHGLRYRGVHTRLSTLEGGGIVAFGGEVNSRTPIGGYGGLPALPRIALGGGYEEHDAAGRLRSGLKPLLHRWGGGAEGLVQRQTRRRLVLRSRQLTESIMRLLACTALSSLLLASAAVGQAPAPTAQTKTTTSTASTAASAKTGEKPRTAASLQCSKDADAKNIHGNPRKAFMKSCKKAAGKS